MNDCNLGFSPGLLLQRIQILLSENRKECGILLVLRFSCFAGLELDVLDLGAGVRLSGRALGCHM